MEELIKKVAEALVEYAVKSEAFEALVRKHVETHLDKIVAIDQTLQLKVEQAVEIAFEKAVTSKVGDINEYRIRELVNDRLDEIDWESRINDNLDTGSSAFECGVKDVVRDMRFRVEVD